jgi:hypothetical protein
MWSLSTPRVLCTGRRILRSQKPYSLPAHVAPLVDLVHGVSDFPARTQPALCCAHVDVVLLLLLVPICQSPSLPRPLRRTVALPLRVSVRVVSAMTSVP